MLESGWHFFILYNTPRYINESCGSVPKGVAHFVSSSSTTLFPAKRGVVENAPSQQRPSYLPLRLSNVV